MLKNCSVKARPALLLQIIIKETFSYEIITHNTAEDSIYPITRAFRPKFILEKLLDKTRINIVTAPFSMFAPVQI